MSSSTPSILHIEDDPNDVLLVQRAMRKANLSVTVHAVNDGESAVAYLTGENAYANRDQYPLPDLILLDLKIPRRSGLEVLSWIRAQAQFRRVPVAVLSSSRHAQDIDRAYDCGANSYLVKPVGFSALTELVSLVHAYWLSLNQRSSS